MGDGSRAALYPSMERATRSSEETQRDMQQEQPVLAPRWAGEDQPNGGPPHWSCACA